MRKIIIALLFLLPLFSFNKFQATVTNDCNICPQLTNGEYTVVIFSGYDFTPKKWIALQVIWPNGFSQNYLHSAYPNLQVPSSGEISFRFGLTSQIGNYTVNIFEVNSKNGGQWHYVTSSTFEITN